jgi:hypothetical protein
MRPVVISAVLGPKVASCDSEDSLQYLHWQLQFQRLFVLGRLLQRAHAERSDKARQQYAGEGDRVQ